MNPRDSAPVQALSAEQVRFARSGERREAARQAVRGKNLAGTIRTGNRSLVGAVGSLALPSLAPLVLFAAVLAWSQEPSRAYMILGVLSFFMLFPGRWSPTVEGIDVNRQVLSPWAMAMLVGLGVGLASDSLHLYSLPVLLSWAIFTPLLQIPELLIMAWGATVPMIAHAAGSAAGARRAHARARVAVLNDREREVAVAVGRGLANADIAAELYMSLATVKTHVSRILARLDLNNRVQIALLVHDAGLLDETGNP